MTQCVFHGCAVHGSTCDVYVHVHMHVHVLVLRMCRTCAMHVLHMRCTIMCYICTMSVARMHCTVPIKCRRASMRACCLDACPVDVLCMSCCRRIRRAYRACTVHVVRLVRGAYCSGRCVLVSPAAVYFSILFLWRFIVSSQQPFARV